MSTFCYHAKEWWIVRSAANLLPWGSTSKATCSHCGAAVQHREEGDA